MNPAAELGLLAIMNPPAEDIKCHIIQENGQMIYSAPNLGPPPKGTEVFIKNIPPFLTIEEMFPLVTQYGTVHTFRLMMEFGGGNRGFGYVRYTDLKSANLAIEKLSGLQITRSFCLKVVKSKDNCRLFIGQIRKTLKKEEIIEVLREETEGLRDVILYLSSTDKDLNRGFCFAEYQDHKSAAMARRKLISLELIYLWAPHDATMKVDWAIPEEEVSMDVMSKVKILYIRNMMLRTTETSLREVLCKVIPADEIVRICKVQDFAFVHFVTRKVAEKAMVYLQGFNLDGAILDATWAKPPPETNKFDKEKKDKKIRKRIQNNLAKQDYKNMTSEKYLLKNGFVQSQVAGPSDLHEPRMTCGQNKFELYSDFGEPRKENGLFVPSTGQFEEILKNPCTNLLYKRECMTKAEVIMNIWNSYPPSVALTYICKYFGLGSIIFKAFCSEHGNLGTYTILIGIQGAENPPNIFPITVGPSRDIESAKNKAAEIFFDAYVIPKLDHVGNQFCYF